MTARYSPESRKDQRPSCQTSTHVWLPEVALHSIVPATRSGAGQQDTVQIGSYGSFQAKIQWSRQQNFMRYWTPLQMLSRPCAQALHLCSAGQAGAQSRGHEAARIPTSLAGIARDLSAFTRKMLRLMLLACPVAKTCVTAGTVKDGTMADMMLTMRRHTLHSSRPDPAQRHLLAQWLPT